MEPLLIEALKYLSDKGEFDKQSLLKLEIFNWSGRITFLISIFGIFVI